MANLNFQHTRDPVVDSMPTDWLPEQKAIANEAMAVLTRHYPGWKWGLEWTETVGGVLGALIIRLQDVPTDVVYLVKYLDMDRDKMSCIMRAGGEFLEALGLSRTRHRQDEIHGIKRTPAGLIIPDSAAMPEINPGYGKIKQQFDILKG